MNINFELFTINFETFFILMMTMLYFLIASYEDFKKKEVYNYLNYSYAFVIIAFGIFISLLNQDLDFLIKIIVGVLLGFFLGSLIFSLGMWGGGDAKFMIGFGGCFAILSQSLHSFVIFSFEYATLKHMIFGYFFPFIYGASIALILCSVIGVFLLLALLYFRRDNRVLFKDGMLLIALLLFQIFALYPFLPFELRLFCGIMFILGFFLIPEDAFLNLGAFKKKTISELKEDLKQKKVWHLTQDIVHKKEVVLGLDECVNGIYEHNLNTLQKTFSKSHLIEVVRPFSIGVIMFLNMFIMLLSFTYSTFFMVLDVFIHMVEFLLLSFTIGGIYVISLIFFQIIFNFKSTILELTKIKKILFSILIILIFFIQIFIPSEFSMLKLLFSLIFGLIIFFDFAKLIEKNLFVIKTPISKLSPGDWIVEDVIVKDKTLFRKEDFNLGINEEQIKVLKNYSKELKFVIVKSGIAFIPHLFAGFLVLMILNFL